MSLKATSPSSSIAKPWHVCTTDVHTEHHTTNPPHDDGDGEEVYVFAFILRSCIGDAKSANGSEALAIVHNIVFVHIDRRTIRTSPFKSILLLQWHALKSPDEENNLRFFLIFVFLFVDTKKRIK
jgi:hypothetical protein